MSIRPRDRPLERAASLIPTSFVIVPSSNELSRSSVHRSLDSPRVVRTCYEPLVSSHAGTQGTAVVDKPIDLRTVPSMVDTELIRSRETFGDVRPAISRTFPDGNKKF